MSRSRNIKPGFFKNDLLAECDPLARILFQGLWCEADREGRLEDRPKRLKAECLPYDDCDIDTLLTQLAERDFIVRYQVGNVRYIAIPTFLEHQNPHQKELASSIPAPTQVVAGPMQDPVEPETETSLSGLIPSSLIPSSLIPDPLIPAGGAVAPVIEDGFPKFWKLFPRKTAKADAEKAWAKKRLDAETDAVVAGLAAQLAAGMYRETQFTPHGATYLNGRRWEDPPERKTEPIVPPSKTYALIQKLEGMKNGLADPRSDDRIAEAAVPRIGSDARD